jgi:beta-mannosidase
LRALTTTAASCRGSIEYGTASPLASNGQVVGGRWKPLHHWLSEVLYRDVMAACGADGRCYVRNDDAMSPNRSVVLTTALVHLGDGAVTPLSSQAVTLPRGGGVIAWTCMDGGGFVPSPTCNSTAAVLAAHGCDPAGSDCVMVVNATDGASGSPLAVNAAYFAIPGNWTGAAVVNVTITGVGPAPPGPAGIVPVSLSVSGAGPALFVTMTTQAQGRFATNAFHVWGSGARDVVVDFLPFGPANVTALSATTRVQWWNA